MFSKKYLLLLIFSLVLFSACKSIHPFSGGVAKDPSKCDAVLVRIKNTGTKPVYRYIVREGRHRYEFSGLGPNETGEYQCMPSVERKFNMPIVILISPTDTATFTRDITDDYTSTPVNIIDQGKVTILVNVDYKTIDKKISTSTVNVSTQIDQ